MAASTSPDVKRALFYLNKPKTPANLSGEAYPPPELAAMITPNEWKSAVAYGVLFHLGGLSDPAAKMFYKSDVLESFLYAQADAVGSVTDFHQEPEVYFSVMGNVLQNSLLWTDTGSLNSTWESITITENQSVLDATKAYVKTTISRGGALAEDATGYDEATTALQGNTSASVLFNVCTTEVMSAGLKAVLNPFMSRVAFAVAIVKTDATVNTKVKASVYAFSYTSAAPVTDVLGSVSTKDVPIALKGMHGTISLDENLYAVNIRQTVQGQLAGTKAMYTYIQSVKAD